MLIEEDALFGGQVTLKWNVQQPDDAEIGLMLCLVRDIFTGDLPVGGESAIGRGVLYGLTGVITINRVQEAANQSVTITLTGDGNGSLQVEGDTTPYFTALAGRLSREVTAHAE